MKTYQKEIKTILFQLRGCPWAVHGRVQDVIVEYTHLANAGSTPTTSRRVSLQIFHAARAIDTFLAHLAEHECIKVGRPVPGYWTLGKSLQVIQDYGVGGSKFTVATEGEVRQIKTTRNGYLHRANCFPSDKDMQRFINRTIRAIGEATAFPP